MQSRGRWRLVACIAPPLVALAIATIVACHDTITSNGGTSARNDALVTAPRGVSAAAVRARASLHERNIHSWVGVAHNRALDEFRKDMRKPGVLTNSLCQYLIRFAASNERLPESRRSLDSLTRDRLAQTALQSSELCKAKAVHAQPSAFMTLASYSLGPTTASYPSDQAQYLFAQIETAMNAAADSYDLANRLNPVLDQAYALDETEQAVIAATVSVAQNSLEYWEVNYLAFEQEVVNEYGPCATQQSDAGYTLDAALSICLGGPDSGIVPVTLRAERLYARAGFVMDINDDLRAGFAKIGTADAYGAFGGAYAGAFAGPGGVVTGALIGGSGHSIGACMGLAFGRWWKIMKT